MPEGHTLHRLAFSVSDAFAGSVVRASSPQGRFADSAALLDGSVLVAAAGRIEHGPIGVAVGLPIAVVRAEAALLRVDEEGRLVPGDDALDLRGVVVRRPHVAGGLVAPDGR